MALASPAPQHSLVERIRILIISQAIMISLIGIAAWFLVEIPQERASVFLGLSLVASITAALYFLRKSRYISQLVVLNFLLMVGVIVLTDARGAELSGLTWTLYLIWPTLTMLVLRDLKAVMIVSVVTLTAMITFPLLEIYGVIAIPLILPQATLLLKLIILVVVFLILTSMMVVIGLADQRSQKMLAEHTALITNQQGELAQANQSLQAGNSQLQALAQRQENLLNQIQLLEAPIIRLSHNAILLPITGMLDQQRISHIHDAVLQQIYQLRAQHLILDMTGALLPDASVLPAFGDLLAAIKLLGCDVRVTGMTSEIVQQLVFTDIDLGIFGKTGQLEQLIQEVLAPTSKRK
ncbi:STAS domain-containing protein [Herpetosiphon geysericola]|uniref:STAS domain-containing protein n=1 Tax=Herpetosiphon geysericola TaxID=70996 RepID=A0A0P6YR27_9CHLR|nr:STAS domain-containing protein [Herpetosiphon geysericola]KPL85607.1 hypothetical protein SE18_18560 [Herpetosiphon geysericola]